MVRTLKVLATLAAAAPLSLLVACSSTSSSGSNANCNTGGADGGTCVPNTTPAYTSCANLMAPTVSYANDVEPVFNLSCNFSDCHGIQGAGNLSLLFLGSKDGGVDAATVISGLVGQAAPEAPSQKLVVANDPEHSYLMHKLDDDQCQFAADCNKTSIGAAYPNCGDGMPAGVSSLDTATRDTIRRWIAQGAKNN